MPRKHDVVKEADAIERCAYCRDYVPVTRIEIELHGNGTDETYLQASVDVCENCQDDLR